MVELRITSDGLATVYQNVARGPTPKVIKKNNYPNPVILVAIIDSII
jgi:hypothetical protein